MAEAERWVWLGGSLFLAIATTQVSWRLWQREGSRARLEPFVVSAPFPILQQLARWLYYIGLPFAALVWGRDALVGRLLGLQPLTSPIDMLPNWTDWAIDLGWAVGLAMAAWTILAMGWWTVRRAGARPHPAGTHTSAWRLLGEAALHETHWAFYRNGPAVVLGVYWGAWAGLGLVALEAALNPWWRADLRDETRLPAGLVRVGLAMLSVIIYLQTMNLWMAILAHWGITWGLAIWARASAPKSWLDHTH